MLLKLQDLNEIDTIDRAKELQIQLAKSVIIERLEGVETVVGLDAAYKEDLSWGAAVLCDLDGNVLERVVSKPVPTSFGYIHGLLAFREIRALIEAIDMLSSKGDCLIIDGHGIWHESKCGLASMLGIFYDMPAIGCAKSPYSKDWSVPEISRGSWTSVDHNGDLVGATVRTRYNVKPVWLSPGHRSDVDTSVDLICRLSKTRIPEPLRFAHTLATGESKRWQSSS